MPERLLPADFRGHEQPVSVEILRRAPERGAIRLRVVNHSDKDVREIAYTLRSYDPQGRVLARREGVMREWSHCLDEPPTVVRGRAESEDVTYGAAASAARLAISVNRVVFADATEWSATIAPASRAELRR
jgi:hypothetical protein